MPRLRAVVAGLALLALLGLASPIARGVRDAGLPRSRAERSGHVETSREADIAAFLADLGGRTRLLRVGDFGRTEEGRPLVLAVASDPPVATPAEARALGRPIVLLQANIHGGEVEGKEATQHLLRRLTLGDLRPLLGRVVVLAVPNYNADGNEAIDLMNRTEQYGPVGGVGRRENARGLDLNRDYMKLDSAEARAFVALLTAWDPHVVVDLHTTNGSHHGYHLTYSVPLHPSTDGPLAAFERETLMPALGAAMLGRHGFRTDYYGNFDESPLRGPEQARTAWVAFDCHGRLGQNYVGLRNRVAILSEAYSYLSFARRIEATEAFCEEILRAVADRGQAIIDLVEGADRRFLAEAAGDPPPSLGVAFRPKALPEPRPILVGRTVTRRNERNGKDMTVALDVAEPELLQDVGLFEATRTVTAARAYAILPDDLEPRVLATLLAHGLTVERTTAPWTGPVTSVRIDALERAPRPFQGHRTVALRGQEREAQATLPAGTVVVRLAQPLGRIAASLLEPEGDDGIVFWDLAGDRLSVGRDAPIRKLRSLDGLATRPVAGS